MRITNEQDAYQSIGITKEELREGDIIFETDFRSNTHGLHQAIRFGQTLQAWLFPRGHKETVHAAVIVCANDLPGKPLQVVEVVGKGIRTKNIEDLAPCTFFVLRSSLDPFSQEVARTAYFMYKYLRKNEQGLKQEELIDYPVKTTKKSVAHRVPGDGTVISGPTGFRHAGSGVGMLFSQRKILKNEGVVVPALPEVLEDDVVIGPPSGLTRQDIVSAPASIGRRGHGVNATPPVTYSRVKAMGSLIIPLQYLFPDIFKEADRQVTAESFCSMFVIECMQIAQSRLDLKNPIKLGAHSTPRSLEDYLTTHPDFSLHVIPSKGVDIVPVILDVMLREEIDRQKGSQNALEQIAGCQADDEMTLLATADFRDNSPFNIALVVLNRVLPILNFPESVLTQARLFGMGKRLILGDTVKNLANELLSSEQKYDVDTWADHDIDFKM